ncbi:MAG: M23 family metallopeptidase [Nitrospirota bacterium]
MAKKSSSYTIFILPDPTSKPYSFSIKKKTCHCLLGALSVVVFILTGFFAQAISLLGDVTELNILRHETKGHRAKIQSVAQSVDDLKKEMARIGDLDQKLRIMTDLAPRKGGVSPLAQGGSEEPLSSLIESKLLSSKKLSEGSVVPEVTHSIEKEVLFLRKQVKEEEKSLLELMKAISAAKLRWDATPSVWPVKEGWVTSNFGKRISPFTGKLAMHNGLDIASQRGTSVFAPALGTVIRSDFDLELGNAIAIDHGYGKVTYYGHLEKQFVIVGQQVGRGEVIGLVGNTGRSTGPHLHYEVRINGDSVNPARYILN